MEVHWIESPVHLRCFYFLLLLCVVLALASGVGFSTHYPNGETYTKPDNTTCLLNTVMTFVCNVTASWDSSGSATVISIPVIPLIQFTPGAKICTVSMVAQAGQSQPEPFEV